MGSWTAIDLFCGAGGLSEGFRQAGVHVLAGQDVDATFGQTFSQTHNEATFVYGPIQSVSADDLLSAAGCSPGGVDILIGGPHVKVTLSTTISVALMIHVPDYSRSICASLKLSSRAGL